MSVAFDQGMRLAISRQLREEAARILDVPARDLESYSVAKIVQGLAEGRSISQIGGLEYELHQECGMSAEGFGQSSLTHRPLGVRIPWPILGIASRAEYVVGTAGAGGNLVESTMESASPIDVLRPLLLAAQLGVDSAYGFSGNPVFPRISTAGTAAAATEGSSSSESEAQFDNITASPHQVIAWVRASRLFRQQNPPTENMARMDLLRAEAQAVESYFWTGSGSAGQPLGLLNASAINAISGTTASFATICSAQKAVLDANGLQVKSSAGWAAHPDVASLLAQRYEDSTTKVSRLWQGALHTGRVLNDLALSSTIIPTATCVFGDFSMATLVFYGAGLEIDVTPYGAGDSTAFAKGDFAIRCTTSIDVITRHGPSFSAITSIT